MAKQYSFTSEGVRTFLDDIVGDVLEAIHETGTFEDRLYITVGSRTITLPMVAETYEAIEEALHEAVTIWEEEYIKEDNEHADK